MGFTDGASNATVTDDAFTFFNETDLRGQSSMELQSSVSFNGTEDTLLLAPEPGFQMDYKNYNSGSSVPEAESDLVKRLKAKSEENKAKNDAERFNYDRQYSANMAIIKSSWTPDDEKDREKLGITRPAECDLPFFKDSPTCKKF